MQRSFGVASITAREEEEEKIYDLFIYFVKYWLQEKRVHSMLIRSQIFKFSYLFRSGPVLGYVKDQI